jgi:GT2 family glycosyltransferase
MRWAPAWDRREQIQPMTMLVRRATFDAVGPFDPSLVPAEDTDWVLRAVEAGVGIHILDDVVLERRAHDRNISADPEVARQQHFALIKARIDRRRAAACE